MTLCNDFTPLSIRWKILDWTTSAAAHWHYCNVSDPVIKGLYTVNERNSKYTQQPSLDRTVEQSGAKCIDFLLNRARDQWKQIETGQMYHHRASSRWQPSSVCDETLHQVFFWYKG